MEDQTIAEAHRSKLKNQSKQLDIDLALRILRLTFEDIENLMLKISRRFDATKDVNSILVGISCDGKNVSLEFECFARESHWLTLKDLSLEDKIYLLEKIERL